MPIADRILRLEHHPADSLKPHPANFRTHDTEQRLALRSVLARVGYAGAALTYTDPDTQELVLIDGHMRREEMGSDTIPVLITDLSPDEAEQVLLTFDALGSAASADGDTLDALRADLGTLDPSIEAILDGIRGAAYALPVDTPVSADSDIEAGRLTLTCPKCGTQFEPA